MDETTLPYFVLRDKLPHTMVSLHSTETTWSSTKIWKKRKKVIFAYAKALYNLWVRGFGRDFVIYVNNIKSQISDVVADYDKLMRGSLRYGRLDSRIPSKSLRHLNGECRNMLRPTRRKGRTSKSGKKPHEGATNNLFDIGRDTKNLRATENIFYEHPKTSRKF